MVRVPYFPVLLNPDMNLSHAETRRRRERGKEYKSKLFFHVLNQQRKIIYRLGNNISDSIFCQVFCDTLTAAFLHSSINRLA